MPESTEIMKRQKYYSSGSSYGSSNSSSEADDNEKDEDQNKKREKQVTYNLKQSNHYKLIQPSSKLNSSSLAVTWRSMELKSLNSIKDLGPNEPLCVRRPRFYPTSFPSQTSLGLDPTIPFRVCKWETKGVWLKDLCSLLFHISKSSLSPKFLHESLNLCLMVDRLICWWHSLLSPNILSFRSPLCHSFCFIFSPISKNVCLSLGIWIECICEPHNCEIVEVLFPPISSRVSTSVRTLVYRKYPGEPPTSFSVSFLPAALFCFLPLFLSPFSLSFIPFSIPNVQCCVCDSSFIPRCPAWYWCCPGSFGCRFLMLSPVQDFS